MKKQNRHNEYSDRKCIICGAKIKQNVIDKNPRAKYCYRCFITIKESGNKNRKNTEQETIEKLVTKRPDAFLKILGIVKKFFVKE